MKLYCKFSVFVIFALCVLNSSLLADNSNAELSNLAKGTTQLSTIKLDKMQKKYPSNMGNNPMITTMYTADPTARVYDGILYLYPSTDTINTGEKDINGFCMPGYNVYSTENYMDWKDYGQIIHQRDVTWAPQNKYSMWAPCIEKNGETYYYYFPTIRNTGGFGVGVATSKNPYGPFVILPQPILRVNGIDPNCFVDEDGQAYLYWGGGTENSLKGAKLKSSMAEIEGDIVSFEGFPPHYKEASFVFKKDDKYYFTFCCSIGKSELHYGVGTSPLGPFTYKGKLFNQWTDCWTSHHSIVKYKGEWILFYHHNDISNNDKLRSVCADYLTFAENGDINLVKATRRGIGTIQANREIQIDRYSEADTSIITEKISKDFPANWALVNIKDNSWIKYDRVDFSKKKYKKVQIRLSSSVAGNTIKICTAQGGKDIANLLVESTEGSDDWKIYEFPIENSPKEVVDLILYFNGPGLLNVDWVKFL